MHCGAPDGAFNTDIRKIQAIVFKSRRTLSVQKNRSVISLLAKVQTAMGESSGRQCGVDDSWRTSEVEREWIVWVLVSVRHLYVSRCVTHAFKSGQTTSLRFIGIDRERVR